MPLDRFLWTIFIVYSLYVWWSFFAGRVHIIILLRFYARMSVFRRNSNPVLYWFFWGFYFAGWVLMLVKMVPMVT